MKVADNLQMLPPGLAPRPTKFLSSPPQSRKLSPFRVVA